MIWSWFTAVGRFFRVGRSCSVLGVEKEIFDGYESVCVDGYGLERQKLE
jgi:hypothetical protein